MAARRLNERMFRAIDQNLPLSLEKAIISGADINSEGDDGRYPLQCAAEYPEGELVELLLKHGANPNLCENLFPSALRVACNAGSNAAIRLLLEHGADPNGGEGDGEGLLVCCQMHNKEGVDLLLQYGANPNSRGTFCMSSPLREVSRLYPDWREAVRSWSSNPITGKKISAIKNSQIKKSQKKKDIEKVYEDYLKDGVLIAEALIEHGANLEWKDSLGGNLMYHAFQSQYLDMAAILRNNGVRMGDVITEYIAEGLKVSCIYSAEHVEKFRRLGLADEIIAIALFAGIPEDENTRIFDLFAINDSVL